MDPQTLETVDHTAVESMSGDVEQWLVLAAALAVSLVLCALAYWFSQRFASRSDTAVDNEFVRRISRPAMLLLPLLAMQFALPSTPALAERDVLRHALSLAMITCGAWFGVSLIRAGARLVNSHYDVSVADNYAARRMHTQVNLISRVLFVLIVIVGIALGLMTFPRVRELGTSLLASAGIAGIIVGLAARPVLENLLAGVQLALTQPINIDDVVIVDGEWGRIEEITTTYVVVRIWDDRRLICPFTKFISESFQNWTRRTSEILGTVMVHADYTVPVEAMRTELRRIVDDDPNWDRRVCILQVTDATERTVQLRALVSASSAPRAWDLRVRVREKLIEYLQREHPASLPRGRVRLDDSGPDRAAAEAAAAGRD